MASVADIVIVAIRLTFVLTEAVKVSVVLPEPAEVGLILNHVWSETAVHIVFEEISTVFVLPGVAVKLTEFAETEITASPAFCVIVICCDISPVADIITVAVRVEIVGFAVAVNVTVALPVVAELGFTVNHDWSDTAVHVVFDNTSTVVWLPASLAIATDVADTNKLACPADCVIVIFFEDVFGAVRVTIAVLVDVVGFAVADNVNDASPVVGMLGFTVNHDWSDTAVHVVFDVTLTVVAVSYTHLAALPVVAEFGLIVTQD